jgi:hypothetical protein
MLDARVCGRAGGSYGGECELAALVFLGVAVEPLFDAMLSVQWPVAFLRWSVIGRNGEEPGKGDHIEQEF